MEIKPHYRIVLLYIAIGALWIFFSDAAVEMIFEQKEQLTFAQNIKGWLFITVTALMLFVIIRRDFNRVQQLNTDLIDSYDQAITGWVKVMDLRHEETKNHTVRVTKMTHALAEFAGITDKRRLKQIERGATLHDIGKIGIPDGTLLKPGKLNQDEWIEMKTHCQIAYELMSDIEFLSTAIAIPYCHHERWDGTGYPRGLKGEAIPIEARIFAIIDVWDALIHPRVYKNAWPEDKVLQHIQEQGGKHFDANLVAIFIENYAAIKAQSGLQTMPVAEDLVSHQIERPCRAATGRY